MPLAGRHRWLGLVSALVLTVVLIQPAQGVSAQSPGVDGLDLSRRPIAEDPTWKSRVVDPSAEWVYPSRVTVVGGGITNPDALKAADGRSMTITATGQGPPPVVIDMGIDTGGYVPVGVSGGDGCTRLIG